MLGCFNLIAQNTCADAVAINGLPYNTPFLQFESVCGSGDDYDPVQVCNNNYMNGEEFLYEFTPANAAESCINVQVTTQDAIALSIIKGCPDGNSVCINQGVKTGTGLADQLLTVPASNLEVGETYYIILSYSFGCSDQFTISVNEGNNCDVNKATCEGSEIIPTLPYSYAGTSCGEGANQFNSGNACRTIYLNNETFTFEFTPAVSYCANLDVNFNGEAGSVMVLDTCPTAPNANCITNEYINGQEVIQEIVFEAGKTYYIIVGTTTADVSGCFENFSIDIDGIPAPVGTTCENPDVIPNTPIFLPNESTVCMGDEYGSGDLCGTYVSNGNDKVYKVKFEKGECVQISKIGGERGDLMVWDGCFGDPAALCLAYDRCTSFLGCDSVSINFTAPRTDSFYIVVNTYSFSNDPDYALRIQSNIRTEGITCESAFDYSVGDGLDHFTTACSGNDYPAAQLCNDNYGNNEEIVYKVDLEAGVCYSIELSDLNNRTGLFLLDGCPDLATTTCLANEKCTGFAGCGGIFTEFTPTVSGEYYIVISSGNTATASGGFNITKTEESAGQTCGDPQSISNIPYTLTELSTACKGDDYDNSHACGSNFLNGNDYVFAYTHPVGENPLCVNVITQFITNRGGVFITEGCPDDPASTCLKSAVITSNQGADSVIVPATFQPGLTYYITVSTATPLEHQNFSMKIDDLSNSPDPCIECGDDVCATCVNAGFESAELTGWSGTTGLYANPALNPGFDLGDGAINEEDSRHTIVSVGGHDPEVGNKDLPLVHEGGGNFAVKLGNSRSGAQAESITYTFQVDETNDNFVYYYAVVLQSPANHSIDEQPFFQIEMKVDGQSIPCAFYQVSGLNAEEAGFKESTVSASFFKPWAAINIPLTAYRGQTAEVTFTVKDCDLGGHYGYAYVDAKCDRFEITKSNDFICDREPVTLSAPEGSETYQWSTGESTQSIDVDEPGIYQVTISTVTGCTNVLELEVGEVRNPLAEFKLDSVCVDSILEFVDLSRSLDTTSLESWEWDFGDGSPLSTEEEPSHVFNSEGFFDVTLTVSSEYNCIDDTTISIEAIKTLEPEIDTIIPLCNSLEDSIFQADIPGGIWSSEGIVINASTGRFEVEGVPEEIYPVFYQLPIMCQVKDTQLISIVRQSVSDFSMDEILCPESKTENFTYQDSNGVFTGQGVVTFLNGNGEPQVGFDPSITGPGEYEVIHLIPSYCPDEDTLIVLVDSVVINDIAINQVLCFKECNGSIEIDASNAEYFELGNEDYFTNLIPDLCAKSYTVTAYSPIGCETEQDITIPSVTEIRQNPVIAQDSCKKGTGSILLNLSGGVPPYSVNWPDGQTGQLANNLDAGIYIATVVDSENCMKEFQNTVSSPNDITIVDQIFDVSCFDGNDGQVLLSVSGGVAPYSFNWSNGQTSDTATELSSETYFVTVTDKFNCSTSDQFFIPQPDQLVADINTQPATCNGLNTGQIAIEVSGGNGNNRFNWSHQIPTTTPALNNLSAGDYSVRIQDMKGCDTTYSYTITEPEPLVLSTEVDSVDCFGANTGSIQVNVEGGNPPYNYNWSNNNTNALNEELSAGTYTVTVTDLKSCTELEFIPVGQPDNLSLISSIDSVICNNTPTGRINISNVQGGVSPYQFNWSNDSTTQSVSSLFDGFYELTVTDGNNCSWDYSFTVFEPDTLRNLFIVDSTSCSYSADGKILANVSGGIKPYSYFWSNSTLNDSIQNLESGIYTLTVTDRTNCVAEFTTEIFSPDSLFAQVDTTVINCFGSNDGQIILNPEGGTTPYQYNYGSGFVADNSFNQINPGLFTAIIQDRNGCEVSYSFDFDEPEEYLVTSVTDSVRCFGEENGSLDLTITGNNPPYFVNWDDGDIGSFRTDLPANLYSYTILDRKNCSISGNLEVQEPDELRIELDEVSPVLCFGEVNGLIRGRNFGGNLGYTNSIYEFNSTGQNFLFDELFAGLFTLELTDRKGCKTTEQIEITQPDLLEFEIIPDTPCFQSFDGSLQVITKGGVEPYSINWSTGSINALLTGISTGVYEVSISDANLCDTSGITFLDEYDSIGIELADTFKVYAGEIINAKATAYPIGPMYNYFWESWPYLKSDDQQVYAKSLQENSSIQVTATDVKTQCSASKQAIVLIKLYPFKFPNVFSPNSDGVNEGFYPKFFDDMDMEILRIYNRWGELVYEGLTPWNGKLSNGEHAPVGVYMYVSDLFHNEENKQYSVQGNVTLLR